MKKCNDIISTYVASTDFIVLAKHSNLRSGDGHMFADVKHITREAIPIFVSNMKHALREAYGLHKNVNNYNRSDRKNYGNRSYGYQSYGHNRYDDSRPNNYNIKSEFEQFKNEIRSTLSALPRIPDKINLSVVSDFMIIIV